MCKSLLHSLSYCLLGLCLAIPATAFGKGGPTPQALSWGGTYLGENALLRIDAAQPGQPLRYRFENREKAAETRQGQAEADGQAGTTIRGQGFDFVLSRDGKSLTVTAWKKGTDRQAGDAKRAGTYRRLDSLACKDGRLVLERTGKPLPRQVATLKPVANAAMRFATISPASVQERKLPLRPGLYLLTADGQVRYFEGYRPEDGSPETFGDLTVAVSLSPDKQLLALGNFAALVGEWDCFSWPDMQPLPHGSLAAYWSTDPKNPMLFWGDKRQVIVERLGDPGKRVCAYDPCGIVSVVAYDLNTGKATPVFQGTDLCDYHLKSMAGGQVTALRLCQPTAAAWKRYLEKASRKTVTAPLP